VQQYEPLQLCTGLACTPRLALRGTGVDHAGSAHDAVHIYLLCRSVSLRQGMPEIEVAMQIDIVTAIALLISVLLLVYLTITLLYPEKF
jgi:K+-transporting ATPase KdpF subunit